MAQKFVTPITIKNLASSGSDALTVFLNGEVYGRVKLEAGGRISWSDGTGSYDTNIYRDSANVLATDDVLKAISGVVTMAVAGVPTAPLPDGAIAVDTLNNYFYYRANGQWEQVGGATLTVSDTKPTVGIVQGDLWFESDSGRTFVYYDSFWVEIGAPGYGTSGQAVDFLNFPSHIIPQTTNTYSLGSPTRKWEEVFIGPDSLYIEDAVTGSNVEFRVNNGTLLVNNAPISTSIGSNSVTLGTHTTGSYVQNLVAGTGVTLTNNGGESATPTVAIGQSVATNANVTFNDVTVSGNLSVSGTTTSINTETLTVDDNIIILNNNVAGTPTENSGLEIERGTSANVVLRWNESTDKWETTNDGSTYSVIATNGNITLGTDTIGNYVSGITAGTGVSVSHTPAEGSSATVSLSANLNNLSDVTVTGTPSNKQLLVYDSTTSQWINADPITSTGIAYKAGVPASPTATGTVGQLAIDGTNGVLYVCTGINQWQKVSLNSANFTNAGGFA